MAFRVFTRVRWNLVFGLSQVTLVLRIFKDSGELCRIQPGSKVVRQPFLPVSV